MSQALVLDQKIRSQVQSERKITHAILLTIQELDITQCYRELGFSSIYSYLIQGVGYSEGAAHRRICAARLLKQCPEVASQIQQGQINLSQMASVQTAIKQEEKKSNTKISKEHKQHTLQALAGKNSLETQKVLVQSFSEYEPPRPKVIPTKDKKIQVHLEFSESDWERVKNYLSQMSHKVPDQKIESALIYLAGKQNKKASNAPPPPLRRSANKPKRQYISKAIKVQFFKKAEHRCEYVSVITGERCASKHFLDIDHKMPLALGGMDEIENLRVLCRSHNHLMAKEMHLSGVFVN